MIPIKKNLDKIKNYNARWGLDYITKAKDQIYSGSLTLLKKTTNGRVPILTKMCPWSQLYKTN